MKKIIRSICRRLGMVTYYHVSAIYREGGRVATGTTTISLTCYAKPWLHYDNYKQLVEYVKSEADGSVGEPSITSITKLGI